MSSNFNQFKSLFGRLLSTMCHDESSFNLLRAWLGGQPTVALLQWWPKYECTFERRGQANARCVQAPYSAYRDTPRLTTAMHLNDSPLSGLSAAP